MIERTDSELCPFIRESLSPLWASDSASRFTRGAFWSLLAGASSQLLAFAASVVVARLLGAHLFGELAIIRSTALAFGTLAAFGIGLTATKLVAETRDSAPHRTGRIIPLAIGAGALTGGSAAMLMCALAPTLANEVLNNAHLSALIRFGSFLLLLNTLNFAQTGILAGFEAFKEMTTVSLLAGIASITAVIAGTWFGGLEGAVWGTITGLASHCCLNHRAILKLSREHAIDLQYTTCIGEWRNLGAVSLPIGLGNLLAAPAMWICHVMLVGQPGGFVHMAVLNVASQWRSGILFIPERLCQVALPMLTNLISEGRKTQFRRTLIVNLALVGGVSLILAIPAVLLSKWIMSIYGPEFADGYPTFCLLMVSGIFLSLALVLERTLVSLGEVWKRLVVQLFWAVALVGLGHFFITHGQGVFGLAMAILVACMIKAVLASILSWVSVRRLTKARGGDLNA